MSVGPNFINVMPLTSYFQDKEEIIEQSKFEVDEMPLKKLPNGQYNLTINLQELKKNMKQKLSPQNIKCSANKSVFNQSIRHKRYESLLNMDDKENIPLSSNNIGYKKVLF